MNCSFLYEVSTLHTLDSSIRRAFGYVYNLILSMYATSMANKQQGFKHTRATRSQAKPPDSPPLERYLPRIAGDDSLLPTRITRSFVKKKSYEIDTGTPPSKYFKPPSLEVSRLFFWRWILLPPEEFANSHTPSYSSDTTISSVQSPNHSLKRSRLPKATYRLGGDRTSAMPYNNTAIPPPEEITGAASLPCQCPSST